MFISEWSRCRAIETSHGRWEVDGAMIRMLNPPSDRIFVVKLVVFVWETYIIWWKYGKMKGNQKNNNFLQLYENTVCRSCSEKWGMDVTSTRISARAQVFPSWSQCSWTFVYVGGGPQWCSQLWNMFALHEQIRDCLKMFENGWMARQVGFCWP